MPDAKDQINNNKHIYFGLSTSVDICVALVCGALIFVMVVLLVVCRAAVVALVLAMKGQSLPGISRRGS